MTLKCEMRFGTGQCASNRRRPNVQRLGTYAGVMFTEPAGVATKGEQSLLSETGFLRVINPGWLCLLTGIAGSWALN